MEKFIDKIAEHLKNSNIPLEQWTIILPSERAKHYLQSALFEAYQKPIFSPKIVTIYQWIKSLSKTHILDKTRLLLNLYEVHAEASKINNDALFDEFMSWGTILLSDFDEMERYLVDPKYLFRNLRDIKEIENWSFGEEHLTDRQKDFIKFWDKLPSYYTSFNELLNTKNACYMGKAYRHVAENIDCVFEENKDGHFLFAGFNALSEAEKRIMKQLQQMGRAEIFIDADNYYLEDNNHEAGHFLRNLTNYLGKKELPYILNNLDTAEKKVEVIACSQHTGQAKVAGTLLQGMDQYTLEKTLVLLADESLIVPLLNNIPKNVGKANITLGLPLKNSSMRTWIDLVFKIQEGIEKYGRAIVYHKDITSFWNHPFISSILNEEEAKNIREKEKTMRKYNTVFQNPEKIRVSSKIDAILKIMYTPWKQQWKTAMESIRGLNHLIYGHLSEKHTFEKAIIQGFDSAIIDFQHCVHENFPPMLLRTFRTLFNQEWMTDTMAYYGNPMEGLQIMGLLETRLLDFETIIVVGMNEGKMPPTNPIQTLIPMDLRKHLNLPLPRDKQGLFAHHFYRLLHQCDTMYITYSASSEGMNTNEPSRYLMQLELELARHNSNFKYHKRYYTLDDKNSVTTTKSIPKTPEIVNRLDEMLASGISASAIKTFISCPLDFYYKYLLKFGEEEKVDESIESNQLGTFVHEVLEDLYRPFCKRNDKGELISPAPPKILVEDIERMEKKYELLMREKFSLFFDGNPEAYSKGKNYLSFTMALELTKRYLATERKKLKESSQGIAIEALEEEFIQEIEVEIYGTKKIVKLKGFADRIDSINDEIRIVDYKTGKVKKEDVGKASKAKWTGSDEEFLVQLSIDCKHFFQLMLYSFLYYKKYHRIPKESAIISLVNLKESPFLMQAPEIDMPKVIELFPKVLSSLLEEIYNPDVPFTHTQEYFNYCVYCV